ncbi:MAG: hypothetical protein FWE35_00025 [Streptosporangiales bacterium]|nr:hypothetical protein [Streptosporangiales bacterium]
MRKAIFLFGIAVGFVVGSWAGRKRFDQLVNLSQKAAAHPAVQNAREQATAKAADLGKTAAAKAPDLAKSAAPKLVGAAKTATDKLPFTGRGGSDDPADGADTQVPYQADGSAATFNGARAE